MTSVEVKHLQVLLKKHGFYTGKVDGVYSTLTAQAIYRAKWVLGYPADKCDHIAGAALMKYLNGTKKPSLAMHVRHESRTNHKGTKPKKVIAVVPDIAAHSPVPTPRPKKPHVPDGRARLHSLMTLTAMGHNPDGWFYDEVRPLPLYHKLAHGVKADCSFGVKELCYWAGLADDPTGENWTEWGNTSTIYSHLKKRTGLNNAYKPNGADLAKCQIGDILLFGPNGAWHATMIYEVGTNPLLWSHGHQGAPEFYRLSEDTRRPISVMITNVNLKKAA